MLDYGEYLILFQVSTVVAVLMLLITSMLFVYLKIPQVFGELGGDFHRYYVVTNNKEFVIEKSIILIHTEEVI